MTSRLSSALLDEVAPLLGSVARLVATGTPLNDRALRMLLLGAGREDDPAVANELRRWSQLLLDLREEPTTGVRQITVEALRLRGLPEATILLAVDTVAQAGPPPPPAPAPAPPATSPPAAGPPAPDPAPALTEIAMPPPRLAASVASLDLGRLAAGQAAVGSFEVRGGPGRIVAESDQMRVTPAQFGAAPTQVRVEAPPLAGGLLWTRLKLVTAGETLEVPVLAQWDGASPVPPAPPAAPVTEPAVMVPPAAPVVESAVMIPSAPPPAPAPSPPPPASLDSLVVALDGSGTHRTLAEALVAARPGATIRIKAGTHHLGEGLWIRQRITLIGDGMDACELVADQGGFVLMYEGEGTDFFRLKDLALRWAGSTNVWADVVHVRSGQVDIERCRFSGAAFAGDQSGVGLHLKGNTSGTVRQCRIENNGHGIAVEEQAHPILEGNSCRRNRSCGIAYFSEAKGSSLENICEDNKGHGIYVAGHARPELQANSCMRNRRSGIGYRQNAGGFATRNICNANEQDGIYVREEAAPSLEDNTCCENREDGIVYYDRAGGIASSNRCANNTLDGIRITVNADPDLHLNDCKNNGGKDIHDERRRLFGLF